FSHRCKSPNLKLRTGRLSYSDSLGLRTNPSDHKPSVLILLGLQGSLFKRLCVHRNLEGLNSTFKLHDVFLLNLSHKISLSRISSSLTSSSSDKSVKSTNSLIS